MRRWQSILLGVFTLLVLGVANLLIFQKEQLLASGQTIFLQLAPVDPRSLIQGDYMALRYHITQNLPVDELPNDGYLVLKLDERNIATFDRIYQPGEPLAPDERLIRYRKRNWDIRLGAESFFFQEGHADYYDEARFAELRLAESGETVLVGLRGPELEPLGPPVEQTK
ncbi:MAG TPA: GDYXXLXY domain-containing protein [Anaerolineae bacterium]|nr:GDYXXLXY domain-containing protein [Anaerolineae bacterium]